MEGTPQEPAGSLEEIRRRLDAKSVECITKEDLPYLTRAEEKQAQERGLPRFKFGDDTAMLAAIREEKTKGGVPRAAA